MEKGIIYCSHNSLSGMKYVGQTINSLKHRMNQHYLQSKNGKTKFSKELNKNKKFFIWGILEECDISLMDDREKYWIKYFDTLNNGYNSTIGGNIPFDPNKIKEFTIMAPNGDIIKSKNICKFCRLYNLHQGHISSVINKKIKSYKGWKLIDTKFIGQESTAENNKKYFIIETPSGDIVKDTGISDFCKKNDLCVSHISQVLSGKRKSHKGYKLPINKIS